MSLGAPVEVVPLKVKYPQGAEKQLIKAILNREVPSGGLPFDVGVVVQNVGTAAAVHDAVARGKPLIERVVTVTGAGVKEPRTCACASARRSRTSSRTAAASPRSMASARSSWAAR